MTFINVFSKYIVIATVMRSRVIISAMRGLWLAGAVKVLHWDQGTVVFLFSVIPTIYSDIIVPQQPIRPICGSETSHSLVMRAVGLATRHRNLAVVKH